MRMYALSIPEVNVLPDSEKQDIIRMACEGGSAGLVHHLANEHKSVRQVKLDAAISSWQKGTEDLKDLSYFPRLDPEHYCLSDICVEPEILPP